MQPSRQETSESAGHDVIATRQHPVYALTTSELDSFRGALERAIGEITPGTPAPERLRNELDGVIAEQEQRIRIRQAGRVQVTRIITQSGSSRRPSLSAPGVN